MGTHVEKKSLNERKADAAAKRRRLKLEKERAAAAHMSALKKSKKRRSQVEPLKGYTPEEMSFLSRKGKKLIATPASRAALENIALFREEFPFKRPVSKWKPKGKSEAAQFRSLVTHLWFDYQMPPFLFQVFSLSLVEQVKDLGRVFIRLGLGESRKKAFRDFKVPMTKKAISIFLESRQDWAPVSALRRAQILSLGGDERTALGFAGSRYWENFTNSRRQFVPANRLTEDEFLDVANWFCNQPMFDPAMIRPVLDYLHHLKHEWSRQTARDGKERVFRMKGRTPDAVLRGMDEWHGSLAYMQRDSKGPFPVSGYANKVWEPDDPNKKPTWVMLEIRNAKALSKEGRAQRHCVGSYVGSIRAGRTAIFSLRKSLLGEVTHAVTVEVNRKTGRVVQVRGKANRKATEKEMRYVRAWAVENDLLVNTYL